MRVADLIAEFVAKNCSSHVYVLTGNGAMYLNDAIERSKDLDYICVRNEAAAPIAAASGAQLTGKPGVVCVTAGPGSTNALAGLAEVWVDSAQILIISGQVPSQEATNFGRSFQSLRTFGIAGIPITTYVDKLTKYAVTLRSPEHLREVLKKILVELRSGRKGPVWLDVPLDVQAAEVLPFSIDKLIEEVNHEIHERDITSLDIFDVNRIKELLKSSKKPMFLLGRGINEISDFEVFQEWINSLGIPYALSKVVAHRFSMSNPSNLGVLGVRGRPWSRQILNDVDLIISLGCRLPSAIVGPDYGYISNSCKIIMVDIDKAEIDRHETKVTLGINKSLHCFDSFTSGLSSSETKAKYGTWFDRCVYLKANSDESYLIQENDSVFNIYWFVKNLEKFASRNTILTSDAGSNYYACSQALDFENIRTEITSGTFAAMGLSLPLAIGAAVEVRKTNGQVFCVTGDGSIELNIQELQTIANYKLPIKVFIINNGGYASMRTWQDTYFDSRYIGSTDETGAKPLNFLKIADAFNLPYVLLENDKDFGKKMKEIIEFVGPQIIEVICDSNQNLLLPMESDLV
jgi:acetolactate synthase-1/2/3 large subunit